MGEGHGRGGGIRTTRIFQEEGAGSPLCRRQQASGILAVLPMTADATTAGLGLRVAHCALKQRSAAAWNLFFRAALTAHKAMHVPKHYKAESLVKAMDGSVTNEDTSPGPVQTYLLCFGGAPGRI